MAEKCWCGRTMYSINTTRGIFNTPAIRWQCPDEGAHERRRRGERRPEDESAGEPPKKKKKGSWW